MTFPEHETPVGPGEAKRLARQMLSDERYHHTACVADAATKLARRYGADVENAQTAAWLHDILKEHDRADLLQWIKRSDIMDTTQIERVPPLWHAYAGALFVKEELGLSEDIANAVASHTAGRAGMSLLEKVVFLADYVSEDRGYSGVNAVRLRAEDSLDGACLMALRNSIVHLCKMGKPIDVNSVLAFNDFIENGSKLIDG